MQYQREHLAKICEIPCLATQLRSCSWNGNNSAAAAAKTINVDKWISPETATADGERDRPMLDRGSQTWHILFD